MHIKQDKQTENEFKNGDKNTDSSTREEKPQTVHLPYPGHDVACLAVVKKGKRHAQYLFEEIIFYCQKNFLVEDIEVIICQKRND